jgi:hypothetical protein
MTEIFFSRGLFHNFIGRLITIFVRIAEARKYDGAVTKLLGMKDRINHWRRYAH